MPLGKSLDAPSRRSPASSAAANEHAMCQKSYMDALVHHQEQRVPEVGWAVDRRTLRRLARALSEEQCVAMTCACCAQTHVGGPNSLIGYLAQSHLFGALTEASFLVNWDFQTYMPKYGNHPSVQTRLQEAVWSRVLPPGPFGGRRILCCPEDIECTTCPQAGDALCAECRLPLCRSCWVVMQRQQPRMSGVPQSLCNDNSIGWGFHSILSMLKKCDGSS